MTAKQKIVLKKLTSKNLEDLFHKKKYTPSFLTLFSRKRVIRTNPVSIINPLSVSRFNSLDIRILEEIINEKRYTDLYSFPLPISRRM